MWYLEKCVLGPVPYRSFTGDVVFVGLQLCSLTRVEIIYLITKGYGFGSRSIWTFLRLICWIRLFIRNIDPDLDPDFEWHLILK